MVRTKQKKFNLFHVAFSIVLGNVLMGAAYSIFVLPANIVSGGSGGIGVVLRHLFNIDPTIFITIFMWAMFIVGFFVLGKSFALKTLPSTFIYPLVIYILNSIEPIQKAAQSIDNPLISAVFGGALFGIGGALIFRVGGSSGGTDIPALILAKYTNIRFEKLIFIQDLVIILLGLFTVGLESALIGIVLSFISMEAIDRIMFGGSETMMMFIVSEKSKEINNYINNTLNKGTTIIPSIGGYTKKAKDMLQVVIGRGDYYLLEKFVSECDPNAFITVLNAKDVFGEGFKKIKE